VIIDGAPWKGHYSPVDYFMGWYGHLGAEHHMRRNSIARASQHILGKEAPETRAHNMVKDLQSQGNAPPVGALWDSFDMQGRLEPRSLAKEVGDSAETTYENEMYVTPKVVDRWKEIHWLYIDARCWKATYGPNTRGWTHLRESKGAETENHGRNGQKSNRTTTSTPTGPRERESLPAPQASPPTMDIYQECATEGCTTLVCNGGD
jgi:hypothetical protein